MPTAKEDFISRINSFGIALTSSDLQTRALTERDHNEKARMLRNGLAIVGFTILEDFIKRRTGEILRSISSTRVVFNDLPVKIKEVATLSALKGIQVRAEYMKKDNLDWLSFVQDESENIASTKNSIYSLSEYSLGWDKPNINADDIKNYLKCFNVVGGWYSFVLISSFINSPIVDPGQLFTNSAKRRHLAAHDSTADSPINDLCDYAFQSKVIAMVYDILISKSLEHINSRNFLPLSGQTLVDQPKFRFVCQDSNNVWKEFRNGFSHVYRKNMDFGIIFSSAKIRAETNNEVLVVKKKNNEILDWHVCF